MEIGLDKLVLTTTDFLVSDWGLLDHNPRKGNGKDPYVPVSEDKILVDKSGDPCYHRNLFYNPDNGSNSGRSRLNLNIDNKGLQIILNPSKFESDRRQHLHPVDCQEILMSRVKSSLEFVHQDLGIDFDDKAMKISRLDMCRNLQARQPVSSYKPIFEVMSLARSKNQTQYPSGYIDSNSRKGLVIYDKVKAMIEDKEMKKDKDTCRQLFDAYGNNLMRIEVQAKKEGVKTYFGVTRLGHLENFGLPFLQDKYKQFLTENVFRNKVLDTGVIPFTNTIEIMKSIKSRKPTGWFGELVKIYGIEFLIGTFGGTSQLLEAVCEVSGKMGKSRARSELTRLIRMKAIITDEVNHKGLSGMYEEIYSKAVA